MSPAISVIIPVYKCEKYLSKCIESVLNQTFSDFQLILVDDGSPDNSGKICDEYAKKDARIKVVHKENGGVSSARNVGLDIAIGKYIMFIDSDDWLELNACESLLKHDGADCILGGHRLIGRKSIREYICPAGDYKQQQIKQIFITCVSSNNISFSGPLAKLYSRNVIQANNLRFDTALNSGEDATFNICFFEAIQDLAIIDNMVYNYNRLNGNSITHTYLAEMFFYNKTVYNKTYNWLKNYDEQFLKKYYGDVIGDTIVYYITMTNWKNCYKALQRIEEIEKGKLIESANMINERMGGGYYKLIKNCSWRKLIVKYKLKNIKVTIKKLLKRILIKSKLYKS